MWKSLFKRAWLSLLLLLVLLPFASHAQDISIEPVEVRIMTFNIWRGGELVDFGKVIEAIQAADADIVGLQEAEGNEQRLADALGWQYVSERTQIISRFPLIDPPDANGAYIFAQVYPGQVIAVANVHLPSDPYGPYAVRDGETLDAVLELEQSTRLPAIEQQLIQLSDLIEAGFPVLLTGDFNTPSHHDWTEAVVEKRDEVKFAVEWPVTIAVEAAGFQDTYRTIYPDPVERLGVTWTYGYPYPRLRATEMIDRIDFVFAGGAVEVLDSQIVGPTGSPEADIEIEPYPSDHRGVVSTISLTPAVPPIFVAVEERRIMVGDPIVVRYHSPNGEEGEAIDRLAILPVDGKVEDDILASLPPYEANFFGSVTFGSDTLAPGEYAAVLLDGASQELSRRSFWVVAQNAAATVMTDKATYAAGEPIMVSWENAPGYKWDWLGIYEAGDPDLYNNYWGYAYTQANVTGSTIFDENLIGEEMLPAGDYVVRLMKDDGFAILAETTFTVAE